MHDNNQRYLIYINLFTLFTFCLEINTIDWLIDIHCPEFSTTPAVFISGTTSTDEDCRCGRKFWTLYIFYWIKVFLKLPFAVSFSVLFFTIQYAVFRKSFKTFYVSLWISDLYIYVHTCTYAHMCTHVWEECKDVKNVKTTIYIYIYIYIYSSYDETIQRKQSAQYRKRRAITVKVTLTSARCDTVFHIRRWRRWSSDRCRGRLGAEVSVIYIYIYIYICFIYIYIYIKQVRIKCRIVFLEKCECYNIVPYGLQICKKPVLGKSSESFLSQWDQVSRTSSVKFLRLAILESKYQLQQCSDDVEVTTNLIMDEYSLSTYLLIKRDVELAISKFIEDIDLSLDAKFNKFRQAPWIHSTGNSFPTNHDWWNSTM